MVVETRSAKRKRLEIDRFSDLPDDILHSILQSLPIRSAAQTTVLSRRWRNVFSSLPDLDFTVHILPLRRKFIVERVLSHRDNNSCVRTLKLTCSLNSRILKRLKECARTNSIQELNVFNSSNLPCPYVDFPWDMLLNCGGSLKVLTLESLHLKIKPSRRLAMRHGFKSLHTITLSNIMTDSLVRFTDPMFPSLKKLRLSRLSTQKLDVNCGGLNDLVIERCSSLDQLDVHALKLEGLKVVDFCFHENDTHNKIQIIAPVIKSLEWMEIHIMHIPVLVEKSLSLERAIFHFSVRHNHNLIITPEQRSCLYNLMIALSHVKTLKLRHPFTLILKGHYFNTAFVTKFHSLTKLKITTTLSFQGFATLFKNCPYLHTLVIKIYCFYHGFLKRVEDEPVSGGDKFWEDQIPELVSFLNHLKVVKFLCFYEYDKEFCSLAKFLLQHGKVLESMSLLIIDLKMLRLTISERIKSIMDLSWVSSKVKVGEAYALGAS